MLFLLVPSSHLRLVKAMRSKMTNPLTLTLLVIVSSLIPSSFSFAQQWHYALLAEPSSCPPRYPLRWGEREPPSEDMVAMPPGLDTSRTILISPGCYKVGTSGFVLSYKVEDSTLRGAIDVVVWDEVTGEVLWSKTYNRVPKEGNISLEGLVLLSYITILGFQVSWSGSGSMFTRFNVFVVLDAPKAPMDPAWVSVLHISCVWARKMSTWKAAANELRNKVFNNCKYANRFFHHFEGWQDTEIGREATEETFHLKAFLSQSEPREGNCNALTNFLCCLMTSVGVNAIVQRTNRIVLENGNKVGRWTFRTKLIRPAGWLQNAYGQWGYHQIVLIEIEGNRIWDGNLIFMDPLAIPSDMVRENSPPVGIEFGTRAHWEADGCETYFCKLVDFNSPYTDPNYRWETNHPNTKLIPPKLKVTTERWENDGCP